METYHNAVIEIINLYKGKQLSKIKIKSALNTSCAFLPDENSTWIIFANRWQGMLSFGFCSGSMQIDMIFNSIQYPNAAKNYGNTIRLKEDVLGFLKDHNLVNPNPDSVRPYNAELGTFKGYKNKNSIAVFQVDLNKDFSISRIEQLKKFQNSLLNTLVFNSMKTNLKFNGNFGEPLVKPTRLILFCYYYEKNGSNQSFLSFIDQ